LTGVDLPWLHDGTNDPYPVHAVKDVVFLVLTAGFFLLSWLYVRACERG
jgi:hypothetical protein